MTPDDSEPINENERQWALHCFKSVGWDLEEMVKNHGVQTSTVDEFVRLWSWYTKRGSDFGTAALMTIDTIVKSVTKDGE